MSPQLIGVLTLLLLFSLLGVVVAVQSHRLKSCVDGHRQFVATIEATTAIQKIEREKKRAWDLQLTKDIDAKRDRQFADLRAANERLRARSGRQPTLPPVSPAALDPSIAIFDRVKLERAIGEFVGGVQTLAERGDQIAIELKLSREWVVEQQRLTGK